MTETCHRRPCPRTALRRPALYVERLAWAVRWLVQDSSAPDPLPASVPSGVRSSVPYSLSRPGNTVARLSPTTKLSPQHGSLLSFSILHLSPFSMRLSTVGGEWIGPKGQLRSISATHLPGRPAVSEHPRLDSYLLVGSATLPVSNLLVGSRGPAPASTGRSITAPAARGVQGSSHLRGPRHDVLWSLPHDLAFYGIYKVAIRIDSTVRSCHFSSSQVVCKAHMLPNGSTATILITFALCRRSSHLRVSVFTPRYKTRASSFRIPLLAQP